MLLLGGFFSILEELCCFSRTSTADDKLQSFSKLIIIFFHLNQCSLKLFIKMHNFINTSTIDSIIKRRILIRKQIELLYLILIILYRLWTHSSIYLGAIKSAIWGISGEHWSVGRCVEWTLDWISTEIRWFLCHFSITVSYNFWFKSPFIRRHSLRCKTTGVQRLQTVTFTFWQRSTLLLSLIKCWS